MKLLTILLLALSNGLLADITEGSVIWHTSTGIKYGGLCEINTQNHSDLGISEYLITCSRQNIESVNVKSKYHKSSLLFINNTAIIECPVIISRVFSHRDFTIVLDCMSESIFKSGFE